MSCRAMSISCVKGRTGFARDALATGAAGKKARSMDITPRTGNGQSNSGSLKSRATLGFYVLALAIEFKTRSDGASSVATCAKTGISKQEFLASPANGCLDLFFRGVFFPK